MLQDNPEVFRGTMNFMPTSGTVKLLAVPSFFALVTLCVYIYREREREGNVVSHREIRSFRKKSFPDAVWGEIFWQDIRKLLHPHNAGGGDLRFPLEWINSFENDLETLIRHPNFSWPVQGGQGMHVIIQNNDLFVANDSFPKPHATLFMLQRVLCMYEIPDMEIYINLGDGPTVKTTSDVVYPVFSWVKSASFLDLLMPYWSFVWVPWCASNSNETENQNLQTEYASKIDKAYWRGSATGGHFTKDNWRNQTRARLSLICQQHQEICDAGLVRCTQCTEEATSEIEKVLGYKAIDPGNHFEHYKIAIMVDGNTSPSSRSLTYFSSKTLILWQKTGAWEFFYHSLHPYAHYIPLSESLCDLIGKVRAFLADTISAASIIQNQIMVSKQLCADNIAAYMAYTLSLYASKVPQSNISQMNDKVRFLAKLKEFPHEFKYFSDYMGTRCLL